MDKIDYIPCGDDFSNNDYPNSEKEVIRRGCFKLILMIVTVIVSITVGMLLAILL